MAKVDRRISDRVDHFSRLLHKTILIHQNPDTGLFPPNPGNPHAWIRDNVYTTQSIWALSRAYGRILGADGGCQRRLQLEDVVVRTMRGLLRSMMTQRDKLERFKRTQSPADSIHAKFGVSTGHAVHGDHDWGHLQIDAISVYLLILAQMSFAELRIVQTLEEVAFVQNLVFYIESAYRIPDYGIWERGDKLNNGVTELNASSIGMAKAALEAIDQVNLFGSNGGPASIIHSLPDQSQRCDAMLTNMLPRESNSKETDAALLTVIGYPAFAVSDVELVRETRETIISKLEGPFGLSRFLRDGFGTVLEDTSRLHYESCELETFENIESEWPLFWAILLIEGLFNDDQDQVIKYWHLLNKVMLKTPDGLVMPELYVVPKGKIHEEKANPKSTVRTASGKIPHLWGQSLFIVGSMLKEGLVSPVDLDPLNRRMITAKKPDVTVQVAVLAKTPEIQDLLSSRGFRVETVEEMAQTVTILPAHKLSAVYAHLGSDPAAGLSGHPTRNHPIGVIATSKFYSIKSRLFAFTPRLGSFYLAADANLLADYLLSRIERLSLEWGSRPGNPTIIFVVDNASLVSRAVEANARNNMEEFELDINPILLSTLKKLQSGFVHRARVHLDRLPAFLVGASVTSWTFLRDASQPPRDVEEDVLFELLVDDQAPSPLLGTEPLTRAHSPNNGKIPAKSPPRSGDDLADIEFNFAGLIKKNRSLLWKPNESVSPFPSADRTDAAAISSKGTVSSALALSPPSSGEGMRRKTSFNRFPASPSNLSEPSAESMLIGSPSTKRHFERRNQEIQHKFSEDQVVAALLETDDITLQAEFLHFLVESKGLEWHIGVKDVCIKDLLSELYEKGCERSLWWLVRHTAGLLKRSAVDLGRCVSSIVIRQKQVTFGYPRNFDQRFVENAGYGVERVVRRPLPPEEILNLIYAACGNDSSLASITQEILIYLSMYIETQPSLFEQMLRIRIGLIIQTMVAELSIAFAANRPQSNLSTRESSTQEMEEEALEQLLNLSPIEVKTLLFYVLSGKEFGLSALISHRLSLTTSESVSIVAPVRSKKMQASDLSRRLSRQNSEAPTITLSRTRSQPAPTSRKARSFSVQWMRDVRTSPSSPSTVPKNDDDDDDDKDNDQDHGFFPGDLPTMTLIDAVDCDEDNDNEPFHEEDDEDDDVESGDEVDLSGRFGFWLRRRRIDGALNRVPVGFYERVWRLLHDKTRGPQGLGLVGNVISESLTQEMTESEMNFALAVEEKLNQISQPEFRQLFVEAIIILTSIFENIPKDVTPGIKGRVIHVEQLVQRANSIYLQERRWPLDTNSFEHSLCGVDLNFYDLAPSGEFGTMTYLTRAVMEKIELPPDLECVLQ